MSSVVPTVTVTVTLPNWLNGSTIRNSTESEASFETLGPRRFIVDKRSVAIQLYEQIQILNSGASRPADVAMRTRVRLGSALFALVHGSVSN